MPSNPASPGLPPAIEAPSRRERLREWLRPPRQLKTTSLGKLVIGFTILIGVAAINTGNNLLYLILGGLFGLIAASGILSERVLKLLAARLEPGELAQVGQRSLVKVHLAAHKRADSFLLDLELLDDTGQVIGQATLRELRGNSSTRVPVPVVGRRRGRWPVQLLRISTRFPFQMYRKSRRIETPLDLWVAPAAIPQVLPATSPSREAGLAGRRSRSGQEEYRGLRERIDSDPVSRIHWKRSATVGQHMVKVFGAEPSPGLRLQLRQGASEASFEEALGHLAGILDAARDAGRHLAIEGGGPDVAGEPADPADYQRLLRWLAEVERGSRPAGEPALEFC